jgi:hypothetical protein
MVDGNVTDYLGFIALTFIASSSTSMKLGSWKDYNVKYFRSTLVQLMGNHITNIEIDQV